VIDNDDLREHERLIDGSEGRIALEALRVEYERRLHRRSNDLVATHALRLVQMKLQRVPFGPPVVTTSS
jgi:hypothetical protein